MEVIRTTELCKTFGAKRFVFVAQRSLFKVNIIAWHRRIKSRAYLPGLSVCLPLFLTAFFSIIAVA